MSQNIPAVYIQEFLRGVKHVNQGGSLLRETVRMKRGVIGNKVEFPVMGKLRAVPHTPRANVVQANASWEHKEATISDWHVADYTSVFEESKTNVDERMNLGMSFRMAIGRQEDQFVNDALAGTTYPTNHSLALNTADYLGTTPTFKPQAEDVRKRPSGLVGIAIGRLLDAGCSPMTKFTMRCPANWYSAFAADQNISNRFFYPGANVQKEGPQTLYSHGVELIFMDDRKTDAYSTRAGQIQGYDSAGGVAQIWDKMSVGMAYGVSPTLKIDWIPEKISWLVCMAFSAGSTDIDPTGMYQFTNGPTGIAVGA